jgi:hypothetical protein
MKVQRTKVAKLEGLKLTESEVSQTIDLKEVFGVSLSGNDALKQVIGQALIDRIIDRTESNKDVNGRALKKYSKEYVASDDFKAFGKSESDVNMTLTGNMLGTLDIVDASGSKVKIGWNDAVENAKAYNHNVGDTVSKRAFFGVTKQDIESIKREFASRVDEESGRLQSELDAIRSAIIRRLSPRILSDEDEG